MFGLGWFRIALLIGLFWTAASPPPPARAAAPRPVTIFAAASLTTVMDAVAAEARHAGLGPCRCVYAASSVLARQIVNAAPAEIFVSANAAWIDYLDDRKAIAPGSRRPVAYNRLVLAAPKTAPFTIELAPGARLGAALRGGWLAMANPDHVPAGLYGKAALGALGLWDQVAGRVAAAGNVRAALALVERGEAAAGVVYETDLRVSAHVMLAGRFPPTSHPPIVYVAALVSADPRPAARRYLDFLTGPAARAIFTKHGFRSDGGT